jgi:hypothetical protein
MRGMRLSPKMRRMDIGARTREEYAVDDLQQLANMRDVRQAREHQRQRIGHLRYRAQVSFSNKLYGKTSVHQVRVPDHANHCPGHRYDLICRQMPVSPFVAPW